MIARLEKTMKPETQRDLIYFLLFRLKKCAVESIAYHATLLNFPDDVRERAEELLKMYKESKSIQQIMETQFHDLDSLIELVDEAAQDQALKSILDGWEPTGKPN
jgi:regulator of sigma D